MFLDNINGVDNIVSEDEPGVDVDSILRGVRSDWSRVAPYDFRGFEIIA